MMKSVLKKIFKIYIAFAALVGTVVLAWPFVLILWNGMFAPAPMPIYLSNGFKYTHDWGAPTSGLVIIGKNENRILVTPNVRKIMWHENTVYGYRTGLAGEVYYFICGLAEDCSATQHYDDVEFARQVKARGLPEFVAGKAKSYDELLWEQSKTTIGKKGG